MSHVFLSHDLIVEILSYLPVKSLMRWKRVCKSWNTLISDPTFVKLHLIRSSRNKHLALFSAKYKGSGYFSVLRCPVRSLLEKTFTTFPEDPYLDFQLTDNNYGHIYVVGSCNGLFCLLRQFFNSAYAETTFYLWNPATRTLSNKIEFLRQDPSSYIFRHNWKFAFGYDKSTCTYKIAAFNPPTNEMRVFSLCDNVIRNDNVWRNIQTLPMVPYSYAPSYFRYQNMTLGVYVSGTVNWLAIKNESHYEDGHNWNILTIDKFVIISFDLSTETYRQLLPSSGFDKVPHVEPTLAVLMDSLCFSHDYNKIDFIIWQMKEFGIQESWIQFLKISFQNLLIYYNVHLVLFPLCLSDNGDALILACGRDGQAIIYNLRDTTVETTRITIEIEWLLAKDYVESLVSIC